MARKATTDIDEFDPSELKIKELRVRVTYVEPLLGTASANKELYTDFIASKAPDAPSREEEVAAIGVDAAVEKGMTVFPRTEDGYPFTWDYQWKGFMKESCSMLKRATGFRSKKLAAFKKVIDGLIFILPRKVILELPKGGMIGELPRPLRASTAQGERVALANSEMVPAGTTQEFTIKLLDASLEPLVREWMAYGQLHGTGQWRNASYGRFDTEWL